MWKAIYPRFVSAGFSVLMYDRRGFGRSEEGENWHAFYESDQYRPESAEELRVVKEIAGIGRCHLVGQCEGGVIAADYAVAPPDEVISLVAASTQCYSETSMTQLNAETLVPSFARLDPPLQAKMVDWHGRDAMRRYDQFAKHGGAYGIGPFDLRPVLARVSCPALVLYPDRSSIFAVEQSIAFYRHLPRGELAVFPGCGHNTYEQRPKEYTHTVLDFIMRKSGRKQPEARPAMSCLA
jgi:pimeloyl-ACP methyl ester carboxylesterase